LTYFRKIFKSQISRNPSTGSRVVPRGWPDGRTHGPDDANSRISQFCVRA